MGVMMQSTSALLAADFSRGTPDPLDCYIAAIHAIGHYAADLEPEITNPYRQYLQELAQTVVAGGNAVLQESRSTLRALLRDYRDKTSQYLNVLREDLSSAAAALAEILESLQDTDGEQGDRLREALRVLREPPGEDADSVRDNVFGAAKTIENCLAAVRKRHQLSVSQLMIEIRMLHKRIDALESAASVDLLTHLFPRQEMEQRIRQQLTSCRLLLMHAGGILPASVEFGRAVAEELTGAVIRRFRNALPAATVVARWCGEGFVAAIDLDPEEADRLAARVATNLAGPYACMKEGKAVRPLINPRVRLIESGSGEADETLRLIEEFFTE